MPEGFCQFMQGMLGNLIAFSYGFILIKMDRGHGEKAVLEHKIPNPNHRETK